MERDAAKTYLRTLLSDFNSHAHVERDTRIQFLCTGYLNFNSHAHVERDTYGMWQYSSTGNFNSHAHVERDGVGDTLYELEHISTHTLTWSVTSSPISIHIPNAFQLTRSRGA